MLIYLKYIPGARICWPGMIQWLCESVYITGWFFCEKQPAPVCFLLLSILFLGTHSLKCLDRKCHQILNGSMNSPSPPHVSSFSTYSFVLQSWTILVVVKHKALLQLHVALKKNAVHHYIDTFHYHQIILVWQIFLTTPIQFNHVGKLLFFFFSFQLCSCRSSQCIHVHK